MSNELTYERMEEPPPEGAVFDRIDREPSYYAPHGYACFNVPRYRDEKTGGMVDEIGYPIPPSIADRVVGCVLRTPTGQIGAMWPKRFYWQLKKRAPEGAGRSEDTNGGVEV